MQLYILRHGVAEEQAAGHGDSQRQLTDAGRKKLRKILARAREAAVAPELIVSSPYVRAMQTAEIAAEVLKYGDPIERSERLTPPYSVVELWQEISGWRNLGQAMVVGHNPQLSQLVDFLIGARGGGVELKKGALASIEVEPASPQPRATLVWLLTAKTAGS